MFSSESRAKFSIASVAFFELLSILVPSFLSEFFAIVLLVF